jgi:hypothetical protein
LWKFIAFGLILLTSHFYTHIRLILLIMINRIWHYCLVLFIYTKILITSIKFSYTFIPKIMFLQFYWICVKQVIQISHVFQHVFRWAHMYLGIHEFNLFLISKLKILLNKAYGNNYSEGRVHCGLYVEWLHSAKA